VARNRKRAKERRARRPQPVATARVERDEAPDPIRHAAPDVELAEAQMALGRPELADGTLPEPEPEPEAEPDRDEELEAEELEPAADGERSLTRAGDGAVTRPAGHARTGSRLMNFLEGSWRELQRVQWPDRRQVIQATGVVIGFVIVAGVYLGVADTLATKLMNFVLK
jgi:preprotein translocase SecE subunit